MVPAVGLRAGLLTPPSGRGCWSRRRSNKVRRLQVARAFQPVLGALARRHLQCLAAMPTGREKVTRPCRCIGPVERNPPPIQAS